MSFGEFGGKFGFHALLANRGPGWRGLSSSTSQWLSGAHILSQDQSHTYAVHTSERTKPLRCEVFSEEIVLFPGEAPIPVTVWQGCTHHTPALRCFPDTEGLWLSTASPSAFPVFCKQANNWVPCCIWFDHTPVSSVPQSVQSCATLSAPLEKPFYS